MKKLTYIFLLLLLCSCDYFDKRKVNADELLNEELKTVNWNEVDDYPNFETCDETEDKLSRKKCFEETLTRAIFTSLNEAGIVVTESFSDTLMMVFQISEKGELQLIEIEENELISANIPNIDSLLISGLNDLPKIYPAVKRGQQVRTQFKLPVVINAD